MSSTPAGSVTQQWTAGDTKYFNLIYKDCDGNPVDLTGSTARMQLRLSHSGAIIIDKQPTTTLTTGGEIEFKFESSETSALVVSPASRASYFFDVELTAANSDIKTLVNGKIDVDTDITR